MINVAKLLDYVQWFLGQGYNDGEYSIRRDADAHVFTYSIDSYYFGSPRKHKCSCVTVGDKDVCVFLLTNWKQEHDGHNNVTFPPEITDPTDSKVYTVKYVVIKCKYWDITLPHTIQEIIIDRSRDQRFGDDVIKQQSDTTYQGDYNSRINVNDNNPNYLSIDGSLYSKDKKILLHYHKDTTLAPELEEIAPRAIENVEIDTLTIPAGVHHLAKNAISGKINTIDFQGQIQKAEDNCLILKPSYGRESLSTTIRINGLLSDMDNDSIQVLKSLKDKGAKFVFKAPDKLAEKVEFENTITLSGVIELFGRSRDSRLDYKTDYKTVSLNVSNFTYKDGRYVIAVADEMIDNCVYSPVKGSRIKFFSKDDPKEEFDDIIVYESQENVLKLIKKAIGVNDYDPNQCDSHNSGSGNTQGTLTNGIIKVTWTSPWHGFGNIPITEIKYEYDYSSRVLSVQKKVYNKSLKPTLVGNVTLSSSKEKVIKQFLENRANIVRFFNTKSWPGGHECTTTLTIEDVDGRRHSIQQLGDLIFPHPFG